LRPSSPEHAKIAARKKEAIAAAAHLVERFPDNPVVCHVMALAHRDLGESSEAVKWWNKALELEPKFAPAYHRLAYVAMDKAQYSEAAELFREALAVDTSFSEARFGLTEALMNLGQMNTARVLLEQDDIPLEVDSVPTFFLLGQIYLELQQYEKARENLELAVRFDPEDARAQHGLSIACARLGDSEQAAVCRQKFRQLTEAQEEPRGNVQGIQRDLASVCQKVARILDAVGATHAQFGDLQEAERQWLRAVAIAPDNAASHQALASLYQHQGRDAEAVGMLTQLCHLTPENIDYRLMLGSALAKLGRFEKTETALQESIRSEPNGTVGLVALAQLYLANNRKIPEAVRLASKAVELESVAVNYYFLSMTLERNGEIQRARDAIQQAVQLEPSRQQYRQCYERLHAKQ